MASSTPPSKFGIIVGTYHKPPRGSDYWLAKACVASIRHFLGDQVPICLLVDGEFEPKQLIENFGCTTFRTSDIKDERLRAASNGLGLPKMAALWEGPFEEFFYLDADTVVWGDILSLLDRENYDFIFDVPQEPVTPHYIDRLYLDTRQINRHFPDYRWDNEPYANSGVWFARRGIFDLEEYLKLLEIRAREPKLFFIGEQGMLNFLVFKYRQEGRLRFHSTPLQSQAPDIGRATQERLYPIEHALDRRLLPSPVVLHYPGPEELKPIMTNANVYREPVTFFRAQAIARCGGFRRLWSRSFLRMEDFLTKRIYGRSLQQRVVRRVQMGLEVLWPLYE